MSADLGSDFPLSKRTAIEVSIGGTWYPGEVLEHQIDPDGLMTHVHVRVSAEHSYDVLVANELIRAVRDPLTELN